jgi:DHA1 family bicyclomycin/chloramphenicol resistance-like MFS transporter
VSQEAPSKIRERLLIVVLLFVSPLGQIGFDVHMPALPDIANEFGVGNEVVQNTVTAYTLGMAMIVLPAGLISDALGRKRILLSGLALMTVSSVGCALAHSVSFMLVCRVGQGLGAGMCELLAAAIAADCFRGGKLASVLGILGAAWGAAPVLAPALGGLIVEFGTWRTVFGVFAALVAAVTILVATMLPESLPRDQRTPVDLGRARQVLAGALRHRAFLCFTAMFSVVAAAQMSFGVVAPFLYQDKLGFSPGQYGAIALVVGLANLSGQLVCGGLANRMSLARLGASAWIVYALGGVILVASASLIGVNGWAIVIGATLALLGIGVLDPLTKGLAMGVFTNNIGLITGLVSTSCYLVITAAMALMAYLPEESQTPLGWSYLGFAVVVALLAVAAGRRSSQQPHS